MKAEAKDSVASTGPAGFPPATPATPATNATPATHPDRTLALAIVAKRKTEILGFLAKAWAKATGGN